MPLQSLLLHTMLLHMLTDCHVWVQRRCYWLLESEDDIVLVHYLNIAQRQQAGRSASRMVSEDTASQPKSEEKETSCQSDLPGSQDMSLSSDAGFTTKIMSASAAHSKDTASVLPDVTESPLMAQAATEPYIPLMPSVSMDALFATIDSKLSADSKLGGEDAVCSNAAVQELLQTWGEEQHTVDPTALFDARLSWQVRPTAVLCWLWLTHSAEVSHAYITHASSPFRQMYGWNICHCTSACCSACRNYVIGYQARHLGSAATSMSFTSMSSEYGRQLSRPLP